MRALGTGINDVYVLRIQTSNGVPIINQLVTISDDDSVITDIYQDSDNGGYLIVSNAYTGTITVTGTLESGLSFEVVIDPATTKIISVSIPVTFGLLTSTRYNFLDVRQISGGTLADIPITDLEEIDTNAGYEFINTHIQEEICVCLPSYLTGRLHVFEFNFHSPIDYAGFSDLLLSLYDYGGNEIQNNLGLLTQIIVSGSDYRIKADITVDESVLEGEYLMILHDTNTGGVLYQSRVGVINKSSINEYSLLEYRNTSSSYYYDFEDYNEYISFFLKWNLIDEQPDIQKNTYFEQSNGRPRSQKTVGQKVLTFETLLFDRQQNDAMLALSTFDDIKINGRQVEVKSAHQVDYQKDMNLHTGTIEFYELDVSEVNFKG